MGPSPKKSHSRGHLQVSILVPSWRSLTLVGVTEREPQGQDQGNAQGGHLSWLALAQDAAEPRPPSDAHISCFLLLWVGAHLKERCLPDF